MERRGSWIWRDRGIDPNPLGRIDDALDTNLFVHFRRSFQLDAVPSAAPARVSADGRYKLYVNGVYLGRGPARCEPLFQYYDVYDMAPYLRAGGNVIAALVHSYGHAMSWYERPRTQWSRLFGCGGFFFECDGVSGIDSDASWRYAVAEAWERDTPGGAVGFQEIYDARNAADGWTAIAYDDTAWAPAIELRLPGIGSAAPVEPFPHMVERDIPFMLEEQRDAARVLVPGEVPILDRDDLLRLAGAPLEPLTRCAVANPDGLLSGEEATEIRLASGRAVTIVVDFERDVTGYPRLELEGPAGATIDIAYGEQLRGDGRVPVQAQSRVTAPNVHRYTLREGTQTWEKFERAGFRYLQLTFAAPSGASDAAIRVRRANVNFTSYPVGNRGAFACSDEKLTRLWQAGAYTLQLCMHDGFEDCPSREQRQWIGDAYVETLVNYACFGDTKLTAKLIRQVAQSQMRDGMTQMATPSDISSRWALYIVDYCLSWIMITGEYIAHTGDEAILADVFSSIANAVGWFERHIGRDGLLVDPPGWIFIDWAEVDKRGASGVLNALLVMALRHAAMMAASEGATRLASRWRTLAGSIGEALNARLWDEPRGVYVDALIASERSRRVSQHTNAALIAAGVPPRERWDSMLDYVMDPARLAVTSAQMFGGPEQVAIDEERQVVLAQPFFMHFVHRALTAAGRFDQLVANIRERWSPMLDEGGTDTLWEHWHGRDSRCHAWSATPAYDLSRNVLGVHPTAPGFARFRVRPQTAGLTWAGGVVPSVKGDIAVDWSRSANSFKVDVGVPESSEAEVVLPAGARDVRVNGTEAQDVMWGSDRLARLALGSGRWTIDTLMQSSLRPRA